MAGRRTIERAAEYGAIRAASRRSSGSSVVGVVAEKAGNEIARLLLVAGFWLGWIAALILAVVLRLAWPGWMTAMWVMVAGVAVAIMDVHLTRRRNTVLGRYMAALTHLAGAGWLSWVIVGGFSHGQIEAWLIGGGTVAYLWTHWVHIRASQDSASLGDLFTSEEAESAGVPRMRLLWHKVSAGKLAMKLHLGHGVLQKQAVAAVAAMDRHAELPPGSVTMTPDLDNAAHVHVSISDPRTLRKEPVPWPGPSMPGASIASPIHMGTYQDGTPVIYWIVNHHLLIMGMTGAGKTFGWAWTELAETFTRRDACVVLIDVTKGEQSVGPLRPGLHRVETTPAGARALLNGVHRAVRARTDWLGEHGFQSWKEGCGLSHLTVWLEEAPKVIALLSGEELEQWADDITAARSAGIRWVFSCQRADFTQLPTLIRGQMASACFGCAKGDDAAFGLSPYQRANLENSPEMWGTNFPGMFVFDVPGKSQDQEHKIMAARSFYWGEDEAAYKEMAELAHRYNAMTRPMDKVTAQALAQPFVPPAKQQARPAATATLEPPPPAQPAKEDETVPTTEDKAAFDREMREMGIDPDVPAEGPDLPPPLDDSEGMPTYDPENPVHNFQWGGADRRMSSEDADKLVADAIMRWKLEEGKTSFDVGDLGPVINRTGRSRTWIYGRLEVLERRGVIRKQNTSPVSWAILNIAA